ncbi:site-2 protease family protein [Parasporobacterium paucivorans]|uniref:Zinc metalloprotease n=1 Tax=Parasporobacterium paucivorans DSM 15970 TaxID=1122934 RepID=A0A1M6FC89_9FIRM|nr:site-2 protease family protein [Parasporobacterium paucivorans]SHI95330.1 Zn-dependent protease (includes SpoIVFB) [Parasporobacterium paucivorans DSM 15970]
MGGTFAIGKIKGIRIEVNYSWFIIFILIMYSLAAGYLPQLYPDMQVPVRWILGAAVGILFFISILLHELSHSLVSVRLGIPVKSISLYIFGGAAQIEKEPDKPGTEIKIAIAGPAMSILLSLVFWAVSAILPNSGIAGIISIPLQYMSATNLYLALFNLIPAFPLDGGRILRALIWRFGGGLQKATKIASDIGKGFGYLLIFVGVFLAFNGYIFNGIWLAFISWLLMQMSLSEYKSMLISNVFDKIQVGQFMTEKVVTVDYALTVQELIDHYILKYKFAIFPVMREGEMIGIVRTETVKNLDREHRGTKTVGNIRTALTEKMLVVPEDSVSAAVSKISQNGIGRVIVVDKNGTLHGIISNTDIINYLSIYGQINK